ncbi:MAG: epimerase, partial [Chloroflexi bacterium]|nr:epimerase [Chloroflexota bacterium]
MSHGDHAIVTGAFSYTGGYIAKRLLECGARVTTLTRHPDVRDAFGGLVASASLQFTDKRALTQAMRGARVFFNTYWIRFERGETTFEGAVENSKMLFEAAIDA